MEIEVLYDHPVSPNLQAGTTSAACAYPLTALLDDGTLACVYRQGTTKHSHDGVLLLQTSADQGATWAEPITIFDGRHLQPTLTPETGSLCQTRAGTLLTTFCCAEGLPPDTYVFSEENADLPFHMFTCHSSDHGQTWSEAKRLDITPFANAGITTRPFLTPDGSIKLPLEYRTDAGPVATIMSTSTDNGHTFGTPVVVATDPEAHLNLCDARFERLADGRLVALLWTFLQESEETIDVHRTFSSDDGHTWTKPQPLGFVGQITAPLRLPSGALIAASNHRLPPAGIRIWYSPDAGRSWDTDDPIQMWDADQQCIVAAPVGQGQPEDQSEDVWEALQHFTFGTPDLQHLGNDRILLTYYATLNDIIHIRSCVFRLRVR